MLQLTIAASFSFLQQLCLFLDILDQVFPRQGIQLKQQYTYTVVVTNVVCASLRYHLVVLVSKRHIHTHTHTCVFPACLAGVEVASGGDLAPPTSGDWVNTSVFRLRLVSLIQSGT